MCVSIWIDGDDAPIDCIGDFVRRFGWHNVAWRDESAKALYHFKPLSEVNDFCLCQVDLDKTAEWWGYASEIDTEGDPMRRIWKRKDEEAEGR